MNSVASAPLARNSLSYGARWAFWLLVAMVALTWFLTLDARHLLRSDEGRYAEIAREMFASGDWVTIRYNGLKYFEKPPFHLWMTVLAYHAFGLGEWQARLWSALSGAGGLLMTAWAARRWFGPQAGLFTALVLLAAPTWNIGSHFNSLDIGVAGALAGTLAAVLMAQHPAATPRQRAAWMHAAWALMAVAILTKGLIGIVLPGLVLVVYTLLARDWALWTRLQLVSGAALMLALTAPWFVLISLRNPEFAQFFFVHEHFQRYTSSVHQRGAPAWYFVPQLAAGVLPWLGLLPGVWSRLRRRDSDGPGFRPVLLLATWVATIFAFFSLSGSKLPGYILPVLPPLAVLLALALTQLGDRAWRRQLWVALGLAGLALLASPFSARLGSAGSPGELYRQYAPWLMVACAVVLAGVALAVWLQRRGQREASVAAYALAFFFGTTVGLVGHEVFGRASSGVDLVPAMQAELKPGMPIYGVRLLDHTLPFYLQRTLVMVEAPDELAFGTRQEPDKWLPTMARFRQVWTTGPPALALMSPRTHAELQAAGLPMRQVAQDARRVVVSNRMEGAP